MWGGGGTRRRRASAEGDRRRKPNPAFPDSIRVAVGSRSIGGKLVIHLCPQVGRFRLGWGLAAVQGACGGASTARGARRARVAYGLIGVAQTEAWDSGVLTEGV